MTAPSGTQRRFAILVAAMVWFDLLLQLYLSLKSSVAAGKIVAEGLTNVLRLFHDS